MTTEQEDVVDLLEKRERHSETPPDGLASIDSRARSEILRLRSRVEELEGALKTADDSIRHHIRSDEIAPAMIQTHAVRAIRDALVQATVQGSGAVVVPVCQWQDISTAPMDGTPVDLWVTDSEYPLRKNDHRVCDAVWRDEDDDWFDQETRVSLSDLGFQATHWMPPPRAPGDRTSASASAEVSLNQTS